MTAAAATDVQVEVDEQTIADMAPRCHAMVFVVVQPFGLVVNAGRCTHSATWWMRVRFECGHESIALLCDGHHDELAGGERPLSHRPDGEFEPYTVEASERI